MTVFGCVAVYVSDMARRLHEYRIGRVRQLLITADECWFGSGRVGIHGNTVVAVVTGWCGCECQLATVCRCVLPLGRHVNVSLRESSLYLSVLVALVQSSACWSITGIQDDWALIIFSQRAGSCNLTKRFNESLQQNALINVLSYSVLRETATERRCSGQNGKRSIRQSEKNMNSLLFCYFDAKLLEVLLITILNITHWVQSNHNVDCSDGRAVFIVGGRV